MTQAMMLRLRMMSWVAAVPLLTGCATASHVDRRALIPLFAELRQAPQKEPVIIIPGALGSCLQDQGTGRIVWGEAGRRDLDQLALPIDGATPHANYDELVAIDVLQRLTVFPNLLEFKANEDLIRILEEAGGYTQGDLDHPQPGENLFLFWYDWRRDLVEAAQQLGAAIERLKASLGEPNLKVHLIAQSMGGLVARYYVKYGTADVLSQDPLPAPTYAGAQHVAQVIMLGTPNNGSLETFRSLHEGVGVPGMGRLTPATLFTMPATYQLLPHEEETTFLDPHGQPLGVSLYDPANWATYGWAVFSPAFQTAVHHEFLQRFGTEGEARYQQHVASQRRFLTLALTRARRFHRALDQGNPAEEPVEYVLLGADCQPTLRRALLTKDGSAWRTQFSTEDRRLRPKLFGLGDGSVTKESLLGSHRLGISREELAFSTLPVASALFVCETHIRITNNLTYLDNMLQALFAHEASAQHQAVCLYCQRRFGSAQPIELTR